MHTTASKRVLTQSSELDMHVIIKEHLEYFPACLSCSQVSGILDRPQNSYYVESQLTDKCLHLFPLKLQTAFLGHPCANF